jgi:DNA phosphorothioation-dependent restriction protein DptH
MLIELHSTCLNEAFTKLLKKPTEGTMAFVRSLPADAMRDLCADGSLQVAGWDIYYVSDVEDSERRFITADHAVDIREDKRGSVLLLVDTKTAGAGMDGIYSAVREIGESELLPKAINIAERKLITKAQRDFAETAVKQAKKIGRTNAISPWREFDFYVWCAAEPDLIGKHISLLGLWSIAVTDDLRIEDIAVSAQIVERLLLPSGAANTPQSRVQSLLLPEEDKNKAVELERFLRDASGLRWTEMAVRSGDYPDLWLNNLKPGFNSQKIISIELTDWQSKPDAAPHKWTGLVLNNDKEVEFLINDASKFEVRWKVQPPDLKAGATEYKVSIVTGSDTELVSREVAHTDKKEQKCVFTREDFADLEENGKWQAKVVVHPIDEPPPADTSNPVESPRWKESREFILTFGTHDAKTKTSVGKKARALVEEAIKLDEEDFVTVAAQPVTEDSQGFINFNVKGKSGRVFRPQLIKIVEENWKKNNFAIGRWTVRVRTDGSRVGEPEFLPVDRGEYSPDGWRKLEESTRQLAQRAAEQAGFIGFIYHNNDTASAYVNAWTTAIDSGNKHLALANTVEVQTLNGEAIGLIVLPSHPIRVAWHNAYDELAFHARFAEKLAPTETINTLKMLDGSFVPMFLPGIKSNKSFVFGDTLGFYAVAMIQDDEPEPQAMIAQMMRCLSTANEDIAPTVGVTTASAIAREIEKYAVLHPQYRSMHINALRAGDGKTIAQALGLSLKSKGDEESLSEAPKQGYVLNLFPGSESKNSRLVGRFFAEAAERRRAGVGGASFVAADERWMLETFEVGNSTLPRLKWAKRADSIPTSPAHLSVAFDIFDSEVSAAKETDISQARPIEAFGLIPSLMRQFSLEPVPTWTLTLAPQVEGEKHPLSRGLSERLHKIHSALIRSTAANFNDQSSSNETKWATLKTSLKAEQLDFVRRLHELSDWVVSVDRNAGIEYFDAPKDVSDVYDTYVIDCVPERQDLDSLQLITSTAKIDEVLQLLEESLDEMALSRSPRNGRFLLANLKAISGRLAMRLAERGQGRSEMIALAMFYAGCAKFGANGDWLSLKQGFLVPLDDVRDLLPAEKPDKSAEVGEENVEEKSMMRADLVYVDLAKRGVLQFTFVEIKYRRLLKSALDTKLHEYIGKQVSNTRRRWIDTYFSSKLTQTQIVLRRKRLARALRFYLDKSGRHLLDATERTRLSTAIDKLFRSETEISLEATNDCGYIFCPEHESDIERIKTEESAQIRIFGAQSLPDLPYIFKQPLSPIETPEHINPTNSEQIIEKIGNPNEPEITVETVLKSANNNDGNANKPVEVEIESEESKFPPKEDSTLQPSDGLILELGNTVAADTPIQWKMAITGNPHLMIAGLPGMGKTTCIINLCEQLIDGGITPIVFSYHDDIETKLGARVGNLNFIDIDNGLGFNPLQVVTSQIHAWLDNIGKLRDIFAAIYTDLGDIQLNEIREAIKESYVEVGYGNSENTNSLPAPQFKRFYEILRNKPKPNAGIIARLEELNDYGFFSSIAERSSILEMRQPVIVRLHATQNEVLQNAMASFALLNIYQNMLLRGSQPALTHAVIFDEAHRAGKLKLLPTMAKESRKFGISMIVASQEAKDFNDSLYAAIANYLVLRVTETDAKMLAKNVVQSTEANAIAGRLKSLDKYTAMFFTEGKRPVVLRLSA